MKNENMNDTEILSIMLTSGINVVMDFGKAKAGTLMKARMAARGGYSTTAFVLAEICTFDGHKLTGEDILNFDIVDYALLEEAWDKYNEKKLEILEVIQT